MSSEVTAGQTDADPLVGSGKAPIDGLVIGAKLSPGQLADQLLRRPRLELEAWPPKTLTLVCGPAGYSKTTLLTASYWSLKSQGTAVAWLTLDDDDRDIQQFVLYLVVALFRSGLGLDDVVARIRDGIFKVPVRSMISTMLNRIAERSTPVILFLDDYERAQSNATDDLMTMIIERAPANFRVVMASRTVPSLGLSRLLARDRLFRISTDELKFTETEVIEYFGSGITATNARSLSRRTEGWPVALRLARSWLQQGPLDPALLDDFSGRHSDLARYLAEQVYNSIDPDLQPLLLDISPLERVSGDIVNAITGGSNGWILLERIEQQCQLLLPLDPERRWFRLHNLFADFLADRLTRIDPARTAFLHRAAANWFMARRLLPEAVRHASLTDDPAFAAHVVETAGGWRLALHGGMSMLRRFASFPTEIALAFPYLRLGQIYLMVQGGQVQEARAALSELKRRTNDFEQDQGLAGTPISIDGRLLELTLRLYEDQPLDLEYITKLEAELVQLPKSETLLLATAGAFACYAMFDEGNFSRCVEIGQRAIARAREAGAPYLQNYLKVYLGEACLERGSLADAEEYHQQVISGAEIGSAPNPNQRAVAQVFLAGAAYERNDIELALELLNAALPDVEYADGWFDVYASGYVTFASAAARATGLNSALAILDEARATARNLTLPRLEILVHIHRVRECVRAGDLSQAIWLSEDALFRDAVALDPRDGRSARLREPALIALMHLKIETGHSDEAIPVLMQLESELRSQGKVRWRVRVLTLLAIAWADLGNEANALAALRSGLLLAARGNLRRSIIDEGAKVTRLIDRLMQSVPPGECELRKAAWDLLQATKNTSSLKPAIADTVHKPGTPSLSAREVEILALLADGFTSKEMASRLDLAAGTVRAYRKNLYRKLNASTRASAIAAARNLALLGGSTSFRHGGASAHLS